MKDFKIYSFLLVKNEADVLPVSLKSALRWSDKIIIIDNGSTDGSWELVQTMSRQDPRIVPFLRYEGPFTIGLRAKAFRAFRHELRCGDWVCVRLDADELFEGDVRGFLSRVPRSYRTVKKSSNDYVITREDLDEYTFTGDFATDRPHIRHMLPEHREERRFMRFNPLWIWPEKWRYPHPWGHVWKEKIPVEHYQYRSPEQMKRRYETRQQAKKDGCGTFKHESGQSWQDYLTSRKELEEKERLNRLPQIFDSEGTTIHDQRNKLKIIGNWVVKRYQRPGLLNAFIYGYIRKSKAERSYLNALKLGKETPTPVGWIDIRHYGLLRDSYYICRRSNLPYTAMQLIKDYTFPDRERHLRAIACFTASWHERGIWHKDYSGGNILFDDNDTIQVVDLNRMRFFHHPIDLVEGCRNFERLDFSPADCAIVGEAYAQARGFDTDQCVHLIRATRWRKHKSQKK